MHPGQPADLPSNRELCGRWVLKSIDVDPALLVLLKSSPRDWEQYLEEWQKVGKGAEFLQLTRIQAKMYLLNPSVESIDRRKIQHRIKWFERELQQLTQTVEVIKPPPSEPIGDRKKELVVSRVVEVEKLHPTFDNQWKKNCLPLHQRGKPFNSTHIDANEYFCLRDGLEILTADSDHELAEARIPRPHAQPRKKRGAPFKNEEDYRAICQVHVREWMKPMDLIKLPELAWIFARQDDDQARAQYARKALYEGRRREWIPKFQR